MVHAPGDRYLSVFVVCQLVIFIITILIFRHSFTLHYWLKKNSPFPQILGTKVLVPTAPTYEFILFQTFMILIIFIHHKHGSSENNKYN